MEPTDKNSKSTTNVCKYIEITALRNVSDNGIAKISIWKYLKMNRFSDMDTYFTEINHVLLATRGYKYDGFLDFLNSIVFISLNDSMFLYLDPVPSFLEIRL
jgi:hypothetical protein